MALLSGVHLLWYLMLVIRLGAEPDDQMFSCLEERRLQFAQACPEVENTFNKPNR